jgi:hypothetical protein
MLATLQTALRAKNSFNHLQRLHTMIYTYGATIIEIVRRKEFGRICDHELFGNFDTPTSEILLSTGTDNTGGYG